jgi:hypothetical protein
MATTMTQAENTNQTRPIQFPWTNTDDEIVTNFAVGTLRDSLLMWLKTERGVHAETLVTAIGALAGCAAQCALWGEITKSRRAVPQFDSSNPTAETGLIYYKTSRGEKFYAGELLNRYLIFDGGLGAGYKYPLWGLVSAAAVQSGLPQSDLPDYREMFQHITKTIGTDAFGIPRAPANHQPGLTPRQALDIFWPRAKYALTRTEGPGPMKGRSVPPEYWPLVTALIAGQFITLSKDTLHPRLALALMMEAAIAMSKVDPKTIPEAVPPNEK